MREDNSSAILPSVDAIAQMDQLIDTFYKLASNRRVQCHQNEETVRRQILVVNL